MFTPQKLDKIREDMKLALSMVESTHNLQFEIGKFTYRSHTFKVSLEAAIGKNGEDANLAKTTWDMECYAFGFTQSDFGRKFKTATGKYYTITNIRPRATKRPICATDEEGTEFIFRAEQVKTALSREDDMVTLKIVEKGDKDD